MPLPTPLETIQIPVTHHQLQLQPLLALMAWLNLRTTANNLMITPRQCVRWVVANRFIIQRQRRRLSPATCPRRKPITIGIIRLMGRLLRIPVALGRPMVIPENTRNSMVSILDIIFNLFEPPLISNNVKLNFKHLYSLVNCAENNY